MPMAGLVFGDAANLGQSFSTGARLICRRAERDPAGRPGAGLSTWAMERRFTTRGPFWRKMISALSYNGGAAGPSTTAAPLPATPAQATSTFGILPQHAARSTWRRVRFCSRRRRERPTSGDFNVADGAMLNFQSNFDSGGECGHDRCGHGRFLRRHGHVGGSFAVPDGHVTGGTANFNVVAERSSNPDISAGAASFNTLNAADLSTLAISGGGFERDTPSTSRVC